MSTFKAELELHGKTATGIRVPHDVIAELDAGKRIPVKVTINGYTYRNTVAPYGGDYFIGVSAEHRAGAGIEAGQMIEVHVERDMELRTVEVPEYFAVAMSALAGARERFDKLSYTTRKEHVRTLEDAKAEETRARRLQKILDSLR